MATQIKAITKKDKDVAALFNQMLGADGSINMNICYAKYASIRMYLTKILKTLTLLSNSPSLRKYDDLADNVREISEFVSESEKSIASIFPIEHNIHSDLNQLNEETKKKFSDVYDAMKAAPIINVMLSVCNNLIPHRSHLSDTDKLDHKFIINMAGVEFTPFSSFTQLNLKNLFIRLETDAYPNAQLSAAENSAAKKINEQLISMLLLILNKMYVLSYNLFKEYSKPDIDVNEFVEIVKNNLSEVRKRIPRCNRAFDKIEESVNMLKDNFGNYYRDFVETGNNTIIMENFVMDVAKNTRADMQTTREFREIIKYYRSMASSQIKNPQLKMLFDRVNENFQQLEKHVNISKAEREDKEEANEQHIGAEPSEPSEPTEEERRDIAQRTEYEAMSVDKLMENLGLDDAKGKRKAK